MSMFNTPQAPPPANRSAAIITISVLAAVLVLAGIAGMWLAVQSGFGLPPTPTPTPTARPPSTPTPNVPATHIAEDMVTQVAFAATIIARITPGSDTIGGTVLPYLPTPAPTTVVQLPFVELPGPETPATPTAQAIALVPTAIFIPNVSNPFPDTPTPYVPPPPPTPFIPGQFTPGVPPPPGGQTPGLPTPVAPTPGIPTQVTPTPFVPTPIPPSPTPFFTATPVVTGYELNAVMAGSGAIGHVGPSRSYTATVAIPGNQTIRLRGRTPSGDWVFACCLPNSVDSFWTRRAYVAIVNNSLPTGAPSDADPNDARWLPIQALDAALTPVAVPTSIPAGDFPLARYDSQNTGFVPVLPNAALQPAWTVSGQAAQGFVSPVAVSGANVLASSQDGQFYSLDIAAGNQRWRYNLQSTTTWAPSIQDGLIYLVFGGRTMLALQDQGNQAGVIWQADLAFNVTSPFNIWMDTLFVGAGEGADARLIAVKRGNQGDRREFADPNARVQQPAIGGETLYVGADRLWALDANLWQGQEVLWTSGDVFNVAAPPVYAYPGVTRLAELYVADSGGTVHALDANTGVRFWTYASGGEVTALAVNQTTVFVAGNNLIRALARKDGQLLWSQGVNGRVLGGPLVTANRVLAVVQAGGIYLFDTQTGAIIDAASSVPNGVPGRPRCEQRRCLCAQQQPVHLCLSEQPIMGDPQPAPPTGPANAPANAPASAPSRWRHRPGWDVFLLAILTLAVLQITGLAQQAALPTHVQDVLRHPWLSQLLPAAGIAAMGDVGPRPGDPIGILLNAFALGLLLLYAIFDLALCEPWRSRTKAWVLAGLLLAAVFLPMGELIVLRQASGPASYTHDGGVIQTEAATGFILAGKNPYVEDYVATPMADWGFSRFQTALYHYPYLPWTFLLSAPFYALGQLAHFYDQRVLYALLFVVALALAPRLVNGSRRKLALVAVLALNPIMALDVIFGQNDVFVLSWLVISLVAWRSWRDRLAPRQPAGPTTGSTVGPSAGSSAGQSGDESAAPSAGATDRWLLICSTICFGLACASKPTAWFFAPFYGLLLVSDWPALDGERVLGGLWRRLGLILWRALPAIIIFAVLLLPFVLWDAHALYDDVWRWSNGQGETGYQIWGWGASNFVLALGLVSDRFAQWPFWIPELLIAGPLAVWFIGRQWRSNTLSNAAWHYGLLLLGFFYASRFLNENYLGYILAFLAIGLLSEDP